MARSIGIGVVRPIHVRRRAADYLLMSVSAVSGASPSYEAMSTDARTILVAKKQQDVVKEQGQALVDLVKQSTTTVGQRLDVYA
jgi:hypothetical protein